MTPAELEGRVFAVGYKPVGATAADPFRYLRFESDTEGGIGLDFAFTWQQATRIGAALARLPHVGQLSIRSKPKAEKSRAGGARR